MILSDGMSGTNVRALFLDRHRSSGLSLSKSRYPLFELETDASYRGLLNEQVEATFETRITLPKSSSFTDVENELLSHLTRIAHIIECTDLE